MDKISIIVADSHYLVRTGLRHIVEQKPEMHIVDEVGNEPSLFEALSTHRPNVLIVDYAQEDAFSISTLKKAKSISPGTNILVISADENKKSIYQVLEGGVNSFLSKQCGEKEIVDAIHATSKSEKFYCNNVLDYLLEKSFPKENECKPLPLSPREVEIVQLVSKGLIAKEIARELNLSTHTIYTHRKNIMKKLGLGSTSELVLYAVNEGIV